MVTPLMPKEALPVVAVTAHLLCNKATNGIYQVPLACPCNTNQNKKTWLYVSRYVLRMYFHKFICEGLHFIEAIEVSILIMLQNCLTG